MSNYSELFDKEGYFILENVIPNNAIRTVHKFLDGMVDKEFSATFPGCADDRQLILAIDKLVREKDYWELDAAIRDGIVGQLSLTVRSSEILWDVLKVPCLQEVLRKILHSSKLFMHMAPAVRCVLPHNIHAGVPAHQDIAYNTHMVSQVLGVPDFVTVWMSLVDIDESCGGLAVFQGSQNAPIQPVVYGNVWLRPVDAQGYELKHCKVKAGDAIVFNNRLIHQSMPNTSSRRRFSMDCRFFGEASTTSKHYLDMQKWVVVQPKLD